MSDYIGISKTSSLLGNRFLGTFLGMKAPFDFLSLFFRIKTMPEGLVIRRMWHLTAVNCSMFYRDISQRNEKSTNAV